MIRIFLRLLGSNKTAFLGMAMLTAAVLLYNRLANPSVWLLVAPLGFLALSLLAAIVSYSRIYRQAGLLVFHLALLGLIALAAVGRMTHMQGHFEVAEGQSFHPVMLEGIRRGPWHPNPMVSVAFVQGPVAVDYGPGIKRGKTRSKVYVTSDETLVPIEKTVGDDLPLVIDGYRIYSTFRKGFAPIITWIPSAGPAQTGTVHMPSYPLYLYQQENQWTPPEEQVSPIKFSLDLHTAMDDRNAWTLESDSSHADLLITLEEGTIRLGEGQSAQMEGGKLRYDRLVMWKGYNVIYDPTISWMFIVAVLGVAGLAWHWWARLGLQRREGQPEKMMRRQDSKKRLEVASA